MAGEQGLGCPHTSPTLSPGPRSPSCSGDGASSRLGNGLYSLRRNQGPSPLRPRSVPTPRAHSGTSAPLGARWGEQSPLLVQGRASVNSPVWGFVRPATPTTLGGDHPSPRVMEEVMATGWPTPCVAQSG